MFLVILTYQKPIEEVERYLLEHRAYLDQNYKNGHLLASGPQNPRTGGVLIAALEDRAQVDAMMQQDPFIIHYIASYELIEFNPVKASAEFIQAIEAARGLQA